MRNLKKVLALVLTLALALSVAAGAAFTDQKQIKNTEAVDMCVALNIVSGYPDGSFKPEGNITRAEFCKMICVMLNGGSAPATATNATPTFSDIRTSANASWAEGFIEYCYAKGIVSGVGDGKFNPNGNITGTEAAKMLLVALGYNASVEGYTGTAWALKVNVQANQDGLYTDLEKIDTNAALTRDNAAQMIWNALKAKVIEKNSSIDRTDGSVTDIYTKGDETLLADKYSVVDDESGVMTGFTYNSDKDEWTYYFDENAQKSELSFTSFTSSQDFTGLYAQTVKVIYSTKNNGAKVDTVFGMYADGGKVLATAYVGDFDSIKSTTTDEVTISDVDFDLDGKVTEKNVFVFQYGKNTANSDLTIKDLVADDSAKAYEIVAIDDDDNGDIDFFVVYPFLVGQVDYVGTKNFTVSDLGPNAQLEDLNDSKDSSTFKFEDVVSYNGLAEDDFVVYVPAKYTATNDDTFTKIDTVLKGDVTAVKGDNKFSLNGTWYETIGTFTDVEAGGSVKDAPVVNGYVFSLDASGSVALEDYAVITKIVASSDNGMNGAQAKLIFTDGTKKTVDLAEDYAGKVIADYSKGEKDNYQKAVVGDMVTYTINSDDEYELTFVDSKGDFDAIAGTVVNDNWKWSDGDLKTSNSKIKYIAGDNIADDAVIFVRDSSDNSYKVITGATLKTVSGENVTVYAAFSDNDSSTKYDTVKLAYVVKNGDLGTADDTYGYVLSDAVAVKNGDTKAYQITLMGEDGKEVTLMTKDRSGDNFNAKENQVISYTVNADGEIDKIVLLGTLGEDGSAVAGKGTIGAITSWDGTYARVDDSARYEVVSDTVILYVDVEGPAISEGSIRVAQKNADKTYVKNVFSIVNSDNEFDLLVVDTNNDILDVE